MLYLFLYLADFLKTSSKDLIFSSCRPCVHITEFTAQYFTVFIAVENGVFLSYCWLWGTLLSLYVHLVSWPECLRLSFSSLSFVVCSHIVYKFPCLSLWLGILGWLAYNLGAPWTLFKLAFHAISILQIYLFGVLDHSWEVMPLLFPYETDVCYS